MSDLKDRKQVLVCSAQFQAGLLLFSTANGFHLVVCAKSDSPSAGDASSGGGKLPTDFETLANVARDVRTHLFIDSIFISCAKNSELLKASRRGESEERLSDALVTL